MIAFWAAALAALNLTQVEIFTAAAVLTVAGLVITARLCDRPERSPAPSFRPATPPRLAVHHTIRLPIRGDAKERDGGCAPAESRPAAGAELTGLLSPRHLEEGARLVSAPPAGHALLPAPVTEEVMPSAAGDLLASADGQPLRVTGAGGARTSPAPTWEGHLAALRATCAALAQPTDEERWPWLAYPWADGTGSFERIVGVT